MKDIFSNGLVVSSTGLHCLQYEVYLWACACLVCVCVCYLLSDRQVLALLQFAVQHWVWVHCGGIQVGGVPTQQV